MRTFIRSSELLFVKKNFALAPVEIRLEEKKKITELLFVKKNFPVDSTENGGKFSTGKICELWFVKNRIFAKLFWELLFVSTNLYYQIFFTELLFVKIFFTELLFVKKNFALAPVEIRLEKKKNLQNFYS